MDTPHMGVAVKAAGRLLLAGDCFSQSPLKEMTVLLFLEEWNVFEGLPRVESQ